MYQTEEDRSCFLLIFGPIELNRPYFHFIFGDFYFQLLPLLSHFLFSHQVLSFSVSTCLPLKLHKKLSISLSK